MTEESNTADLLGLSAEDQAIELEDRAIPAMPDDDAHVDHRNEISPDEEQAFLRDVLGVAGAKQAREQTGRLPHRAQEQVTNNREEKPINPGNKPLHPSVTEEYFTDGGKQVKAVHDEIGTMWHIEFIPGGELPASLKGKYTSEDAARKDIKKYLATR
jgi:hypothetical protein